MNPIKPARKSTCFPSPLALEQRKPYGLVGKTLLAVSAWLCIWLLLASLDRPPGLLTIDVDTQLELPTHARAYYDIGRGINPADSTYSWIRPGRDTLRFSLPPGNIETLRLDPFPDASPIRIESITVRTSRQSDPVSIPLDRVQFEGSPNPGVPADEVLFVAPATGAEATRLLIVPTTPIIVAEPATSRFVNAATATVLALALFAVWRFAPVGMWTWSTGVGLGLFVAFLLAWTMAWGTPWFGAVHPDEVAHVWAYQFYLDHVLPKPVDDPSLVRSISVYGFSYLFELDVVYALAARSVGALASWFTSDTISARCFNLALLAALCCLAFRSPRHALSLSVVLLSPQIWYVFSYFNADAFPLALSLIAACLVADEHSGLNRFLDGRSRANWSLLFFIVAVGLILVSKRNYLPVVPVFFLWLAVRHLNLGWRGIAVILGGLLMAGSAIHLQALPGWAGTHRGTLLAIAGALVTIGTMAVLFRRLSRVQPARPVLLRLVASFGLALAVAAPRVVVDLTINGSPGTKAATLAHIAETHAGHGFKPSHLDQDFAYFGRALAQRGVSLEQSLFEPYHWVRTSANSAYGFYGYFVAQTHPWVLHALQILTLATVIVASIGMVAWNRVKAGPMLLLFAGGVVLIAANSALHSWTFDHQPQGRYLLPVFVMLALMIGTAYRQIRQRMLAMLVATAFFLACASFLGTGLPALVQ